MRAAGNGRAYFFACMGPIGIIYVNYWGRLEVARHAVGNASVPLGIGFGAIAVLFRLK